MSNNKNSSVAALIQNAFDDGILSAQSFQTLTNLDLGNQIQAGLGVSVNNVHSSEVVLLTMMVDDSSSIRFSGNSKVVCDGHNLVIEALLNTKQSSSILAHTCYLNGHVLFPYLPLALVDTAQQQKTGKIVYMKNPDVLTMSNKNFNPNMGTPLYDQTVVLLGRVLTKYQEFADNGVVARTITLIITDGADEHSLNATADTVRSLVKDLQNEHHIVAGMGISNNYCDFKQIFNQMGIPDEWILTPGNNQKEIHQAFQVFSQSAIRVSQTSANFSQSALGGFGN